MPAEIESGESAHETLLDELQGGGEHGDRAWIRWVALTAMILALFSSVGALLAGITSTEAVMERTEEILELSRLEGDRLHIEILRSKHDLLRSLEKPLDLAEIERIQHYEEESAELAIAVAREEVQVGMANDKHGIFALGVTLLSIAITLSGMSIMADVSMTIRSAVRVRHIR